MKILEKILMKYVPIWFSVVILFTMFVAPITIHIRKPLSVLATPTRTATRTLIPTYTRTATPTKTNTSTPAPTKTPSNTPTPTTQVVFFSATPNMVEFGTPYNIDVYGTEFYQSPGTCTYYQLLWETVCRGPGNTVTPSPTITPTDLPTDTLTPFPTDTPTDTLQP